MHLLVLSLLSLVLMVVSVIVQMTFGGVNMNQAGNESALLLWNSFSQLMIFALPALLVVRIYYAGAERGFLRLDFSPRRWLLALVGVGVLALSIPLIECLTQWNDGWHWTGPWEAVERKLRAIGQQSQLTVQAMMTHCHPLLNLFGLALVPAVCEELFFRAGVQNLLHRWLSKSLSTRYSPLSTHLAIWLTAAIFSLVHGEVFAFMPRFALGALLGYLYFYGQSILVNITVHFINNAIVVALYWLAANGVSSVDPEATMALPWPMVVGCSAAAVVVLWFVFVKRLKTSK